MPETNFENATLKLLIEDTDGIVTVASLQQTPATPSGGGSFLSHEIARVDPAGDDDTGEVGDLAKPFLTVQAAIDALEAGSFTYPIIDIGNNHFGGTVTTSLRRIRFMGTADEIQSGADYFSHVCRYLISTITSDGFTVEFWGCEIDSLTSATSGLLMVLIQNASIAGFDGAISAVGAIDITGNGPVNSAIADVVTSSGGGQIHLRNAYVEDIDSPSSNIIAERGSLIRNISSANNVSLSDSRIFGSNSASGTTTYSDQLLTKIVFPDADPHVAGAAYWVAGALVKSAG